ncbi:uncharacterized protein A4U43_C05F17960 [Asparagus officinalis]|uniref:Uncharacterized protein n=1 Tax=Asparagus officinalis TaxID=4686 RepID=A0A5P1ETH7_ASPOF|nr:uncharacterized protein LOC109844042 [Asparagus officinalis]ONK68973.1 uncharacterized protein A4U43_C05F17960 [Asparagus officinalis]
MRALLSHPSPVVVVVNGDSQEEEEEEDHREIDIWPPTIMVEDEEMLNEQDELGIAESKMVVEEEASKKQNESVEKRQLEMQSDETDAVTIEHGIEMRLPTINIDITRDEGNMEEDTIRFMNASSLNDRKDIIQDSGLEEEERLMQDERQTEEKEQQRNREDNEKGRENINEQQIIESSDYPFSVDVIGTESGEKVNRKIENEKGDGEVEEFQYMLTEVSIVTSDESNKVTQQTKFVGYEKEAEVDTVNQIKLMLEGRSKGMEDTVTDTPPLVLETEGYLTATDRPLASVPEDRDLYSKRSDLSSEHAFLGTSYKVRGDVEPIEIDRGVMGEESVEKDRSTAILNRGTDMITAYDSVVVAPSENEREVALWSRSTEYASAVQDHSLDMTDAECGPAKIVIETAEVKEDDDDEGTVADEMKQTEVTLGGRSEDVSALVLETKELLTDVDHSLAAIPEEKALSTDSYEDGGIFKPIQVEGGVTGEENVGNDRSPALSNGEDHVITAYDYFVGLAPLKSERGIVVPSMSTEYASAVADHSLDAIYTESGSAKMIVGAAVVKESDDEEETTVDKVKPKEVKSAERSKGMVDEVKDMAPLVLEEAEDLLAAVNHSLTAIPEDSVIHSKGHDLGSENTFSTTSCNDGVTNKPIHVEGRIKREENVEIDRSTFILNREDHVITAYHSVAVAPLVGESDIPVSSMSAEYASAVEDHSSDMTDAESGNAKIIVETVEVERSDDDEIIYSQEMIWEQLHAMRTIVGYKAVACSSLVEELKALYLFTGVEPPVSLKDTSDLVEIGDKVKFLKAVIGVK